MASKVNIFLIVGADDFLVESAVKEIIARALPSGSTDSALEVIEGRASNEETRLANLAEVQNSYLTPPFLDPVKVTWWQRVDYLGQDAKPSAAVTERLKQFAQLLENNPIGSNQYFIVSTAKCNANESLAKVIAKVGHVQSFEPASKARDRFAEAVERAVQFAKQEGLEFAPGVEAMFVATVGNDSRTIMAELAKLHTYKWSKDAPATLTITAEDVTALCCTNSEEPAAWDLTDAIAQRNVAKFWQVYRNFDTSLSGTAIRLFAVVEGFFRDAVVYRDAMAHGWLTASGWARELDGKTELALNETGLGPDTARSTWAARKAAQTLGIWSLTELRLARMKLLRARERMVSTGDSANGGELLLHTLLQVIKR